MPHLRMPTDAALADAQGLQHLIKGPDGIRHTGLEHIVGIHQQRGIVGIDLAVGLECLILAVEHLDPGMGHGAAGRYAVQLVGDRAGGACTAADISRPGSGDGAVRALGPAGAELQHRSPLGRPDDPVGLGGDQALVVDGQQGEGLDQLGLDGRRPDRHHRLPGEDRRPLRHRPDVARETEVPQVAQEILGEQVLVPQEGDVLLVEVQVLNILDQLFQTRADREPAVVRHVAEKHIEIGDPILEPCPEIAVAHSQLIKIAEHRQIEFLFRFHNRFPCAAGTDPSMKFQAPTPLEAVCPGLLFP